MILGIDRCLSSTFSRNLQRTIKTLWKSYRNSSRALMKPSKGWIICSRWGERRMECPSFFQGSSLQSPNRVSKRRSCLTLLTNLMIQSRWWNIVNESLLSLRQARRGRRGIDHRIYWMSRGRMGRILGFIADRWAQTRILIFLLRDSSH